MVEILEITDEESLKAWLEAVPERNRRAWAVFIASRAAARVAPLMWAGFHRDTDLDLTDLRVWRVLPVSRVAGVCSNCEISGYFAASETASFAYRSVRSENAQSGMFGARDAAYAADPDCNDAAILDYVGSAVTFSCAANFSIFGSLEAVRADARHLAGGGADRAHPPLWPDTVPEHIAVDWAKVKTALRATDSPEDWDFWIDWYEAELAGRPMLPDSAAHWHLLADIFEVKEGSKLSEENWEKGSAHVNPIIRRHYEAAKRDAIIRNNPLGQAIVLRSPTGKLASQEIETRDLSLIVKDIRTALRDFKSRCKRSTGNIATTMIGACADPIEELRRKIGSAQKDARTLLRVIEETRQTLSEIAASEGFSDQSNMRRLLDSLGRGGEDICAAAPEVMAEVERWLAIRGRLFTADQRRRMMQMAAGMMLDRDGPVQSALAWSLSTIADEASSDEQRGQAWTFLLAAVPRGERAMAEAGREGTDPSEPSLKDRAVEMADAAQKIDRGIDAFQEAVAEGAPWAPKAYTEMMSGNLWGIGSGL